MAAIRSLALLSMGLGLAACVTINVYFPAAAAEQAADRVIEDVWGKDAEGEDGGADVGADSSSAAAGPILHLAWAALAASSPAAHAAPADIDIDSPATRRIIARMESRHEDLRPYYESGAVGLTADAKVMVRDMASVPLAQRNQVRRLVAEDNADREELYAEIARANGHPEWEPDIRAIFAERWIAKARSGWWYQQDDGSWARK